MCTGALLLDPQKELSIRRILVRYFLRILLILMFWSLAYEFYFIAAKLLLYGEYEPGACLNAFVRVLTFRHYFTVLSADAADFLPLLPALRVL